VRSFILEFNTGFNTIRTEVCTEFDTFLSA
jgi:hypothetical protein